MSKSTPIWKATDRAYAAMRRRHAALWCFLPAFIEEFGVQTMIEIGCGPAPLASHVGQYLGIDLNEEIAQRAQKRGVNVVSADWLTMSLQHLQGIRPDLLLASAVVEHCADYRPFVDRMLSLKPRFVIVTFFLGLDGAPDATDTIRQKEENGVTYYENRYAMAGLVEFLDARGLMVDDSLYETHSRCHFVELPTHKQKPDLVLILTPGQPAERLQERVDALAHTAIGGDESNGSS